MAELGHALNAGGTLAIYGCDVALGADGQQFINDLVTDTGAIEKSVDEIIAANPDKVEQVRAKPTMLGWFVGQVMKTTGGKANPQAVSDLLKAKLGI